MTSLILPVGAALLALAALAALFLYLRAHRALLTLTRNYYPATPWRSSNRQLRARLREVLGRRGEGGER